MTSAATKRRIVQREVRTTLVLPEGSNMIAKIIAPRGNNLHQVEDQNGETYLVSMPNKFRKTIWVKRENFLIINPIEEGNKVKAEIVHVLDNVNILHIYDEKLWPSRFLREAEQLTRMSKRNSTVSGKRKGHEMIDEDMLPPSCSSENEESENESIGNDKSEMEGIVQSTNGKEVNVSKTRRIDCDRSGETDETDSDNDDSSDDCDEGFTVYNPNRVRSR